MFHACWRLIRKYPHLAVLIAGAVLSAAVTVLDYCITARQNWLLASHAQPAGMDAVLRDILKIHVCGFQAYGPVVGGSFSLGVGIGLLGLYLMVRSRIVNRPGTS